jgi:hypothetical protein
VSEGSDSGEHCVFCVIVQRCVLFVIKLWPNCIIYYIIIYIVETMYNCFPGSLYISPTLTVPTVHDYPLRTIPNTVRSHLL